MGNEARARNEIPKTEQYLPLYKSKKREKASFLGIVDKRKLLLPKTERQNFYRNRENRKNLVLAIKK